MIRHLGNEVPAKRWIPWVAIVLDLAVWVPFMVLRARSDPFAVVITVAVAAMIVVTRWLVVRHRGSQRTEDHEKSHQQRSN